VHEATNKETGDKVAVKIIDKSSAAGSDADAKRLQTEVEILTTVKHPNIVALRDLFETDKKLYLVMELVTGGELFDKIVEKGQYTEKDAATIVRKMLSAIKYLHSKGISHRDLKPENLLLTAEDDTDVKLSDFGLSKIVGEDSLMETACGTPYYVAPEVLSAQGYEKEVDLWSIGVVTYLLLCGFPPFYGESLPEVFEQIMNADYEFPSPYWDDISEGAKDVVKKLLVVDPKKRMTADECLAHNWVKEDGSASTTKLNIGKDLKKHQTKRREEKAAQAAGKK
jgi:calcium/calmodulin-dependent protein kinase I